MDNLINIIEEIDTENFTLIIPSVAVGNVGQLTVDLLIPTYNFKKYATVWDPAIIPSVGGDPFFNNVTETSTACELFIREDLKVVAMQLRSGIEYKLALKFFNKLKTTIAQLGFKQVIILTSAYAHELHDISSSHFRYITTERSLNDYFKTLDVLPMEVQPNGQYLIFGGGFASKLYEILKDQFTCTVLVKYASEGDNQPDALQMMKILSKLLKDFDKNANEIIFPVSWQYAFGNPPPVGIY